MLSSTASEDFSGKSNLSQKKLTIHLCVMLLILFLIADLPIHGQQTTDDELIWSVFKPNQTSFTKTKSNSNWVPAKQTNRFYKIGSGIIVGPNFRLHPDSTTTQSEMSIDVHPSNPNIIFCSANASDWPATMLYGTGVYWSTDGAANWTGFDIPPFGNNQGDPVSIIGSNGYFYENYINLTNGQGVSVSTDFGNTWSSYTIAPSPGYLADKNHFMVDKNLNSPYLNRAYCSWTDFGGPFNYEVVLRYSTDYCQTWTSSINLSESLTPGVNSFAQGTNVQTGPEGEVYVTYAIYDSNWTDGEDAIGFSKSTDGGNSWVHMRVYEQENFGIRNNLASKDSIRVDSFPCMTVDKSGSPYNGNIYICWAQRNIAPAGTDPDIVMIKSSDGGDNWIGPVRINNDPLNNGKDQYFPWCTVDQATGQLVFVFYDSRDVSNNQAEVFMATSTDGGSTFDNFKVSDQLHTPTPIQGAPSGYTGDYIGVTALNNRAYPFWMDNRTGNYQGWMATVDLITPVELTSFTATSQNDLVELQWTTATEINNHGFEVQRSSGNSDFVTIGFEKGYGTTTEEHHYNFKDRDVSGLLYYRLKQVDFDGSYEYSDIVEVKALGNVHYELSQNYPNPFNPATTIKYSIPEKSNVTLRIYDLLGNEVEALVSEEIVAGNYELTWNAADFPSGIYFYKLQTSSFIETKKMILLK